MTQVTAERSELSTELDAVAVELHKKLEELNDVQGALECVERLVRSIFAQFVEALDAFFNQVGTHLVDHFSAWLEVTYTGSQLSRRYALPQVSSVGATSIEMQGSTFHDGGDGGGAVGNPSTPVPSKAATPPTKGSRGHSKRAIL